MKVKDVMTTNVVTVQADTPFKDIVDALVMNNISGVPVVDGDGRLLGLVTEGDLVPKEAYAGGRRRRSVRTLVADLVTGRAGDVLRKAGGTVAADLMTRIVETAKPGDAVSKAARRMVERGVKRLPVVEGDMLVGIVSRHDVLRVFHRSDEELRSVIERHLQRCLFFPPDHEITISVREGIATIDGVVLYEGDVRVVEALVGGLDGVVGIVNRLRYRERNPK